VTAPLSAEWWADATRRMVAQDAAELRAKSDIYRTAGERHAMQWAGIRGWLRSLAAEATDEVLGAATRALLAAVDDPANDLNGGC